MKKFVQFFVYACLLGYGSALQAQTEISIAPVDCYSGMTATQMNDAAVASHGASPFATWKAAYDYAHTGAGASSVTTINFAPGTYLTDNSGNWGDADGGYVLKNGLTVNGNGTFIDNTPLAGTSQLCFATLTTNCTVSGFTFYRLSGNSTGGALAAGGTGWTVSNCNFDNCNLSSDALKVTLTGTQTGTITGCNFYNNLTGGAVYASPGQLGTGTASALAINGSLTSDLNIINSNFTCNFRNASGGAIQIHTSAHVDFTGCSFSRNEANVSSGGAVSITSSAQVTFTSCNFNRNFTSGGTGPGFNGGAVRITDMAKVTFDGCNFTGNNSTVGGGASGSYGGAIYIDNSNSSGTIGDTIRILNSQFYNNIGERGGAVYTNVSSRLYITNSYFTGNQSNGTGSSSTGGGAVYARHDATSCGSQAASFLTINGCTMTGNSYAYAATNRGGGLRVLNSSCVSTVNINNTLIDNNTGNGGEYNFNHASGVGSTVNVTNSVICTTSTVTQGNCASPGSTGYSGTISGPLAALSSCPTSSPVASNCANQGSIAGTVFRDTEVTPDGQQNDPMDIGMSGVVVYLYSSAGVKLDSTTTDASGNYFFGGLSDGSYYIAYKTPTSGSYIYNTLYNQGATPTDSDFDGVQTQTVTISTNTSSGTNSSSVNSTDGTSGSAHYQNVDAGFTYVDILPLKVISFKGRNISCGKNVIELRVVRDETMAKYVLQRSSDNVRFVDVVEKNANEEFYTFADNDLAKVKYYYRVKAISNDGVVEYSNIIALNTCKDNFGANLYPNPVTQTLSVDIYESNNNYEIAKLVVRDVNGKDVIELNNITQQMININVSSLPNGLYTLMLLSANDQVVYKKFVKQ